MDNRQKMNDDEQASGAMSQRREARKKEEREQKERERDSRVKHALQEKVQMVWKCSVHWV